LDFEVEFYVSINDESPVENFLSDLDPVCAKKCRHYLALLQTQGPSLREPHCKHLDGNVFELRPLCRHVQYRMLYGRTGDRRFAVVHAFQKSSKHRFEPEIALAHQRLEELEARRAQN
jgi:phage-related protein